MTESSNNNYTAADIERYHAGKMSAPEMHALEKAAMEDPFLADALEGYVQTATPQQDLAHLRTRLFGENRETKAVPLIRRNNNWLKAAVIILVAGGAWLAIELSKPEKTQIAAGPEKPQKPLTGDSTQNSKFADALAQSKSKQDTLITSNVVINASRAKKTVTLQKNDLSTYTTTSDDYRVEEAQEAPNLKPLAATTSDSIKSGNLAVDDLSRRQNTVAYNKDFTNMSASNATTKMPLPGYNNAFKLPARKDSNDLEFLSKESKARPGDSITNLNIVLQPDNTNLNEVVVSSGKKREADISSFELKVDTLEPQDGWPKFDEYIASNIQVPDELKSKQQPYSGEVELSFDVNKDGEPINITVTKSLCSKCDEEAIRLLKAGPKWKKKKAKKGRVTIRF
jgi:hypothetical protein